MNDSFKRKKRPNVFLDDLSTMKLTDSSHVDTIQSYQKLMIHNQCSNIKLTSPVYFCNGAACSELSDQRVDIDARISASFEINTIQDDFEGALLFRLQRYSNRQRNMDESITETNEATCIQMLIVWEVKDSKSFVCVLWVEHTKAFTWDKDKLKKLYNKNLNWFKEFDYFRINTWIMDNHIALKTIFNASDLKRIPKLDVSISEERYVEAMKTLWIDTER
jgi:hypothetical protein